MVMEDRTHHSGVNVPEPLARMEYDRGLLRELYALFARVQRATAVAQSALGTQCSEVTR